jgi:carbonic anhydrase
VDPAILFNLRLGECLVVRNIANTVIPYDASNPRDNTTATLEFAVKTLGVKNIVVLGHSDCSGIKAMMSTKPENASDHSMGSWLSPQLSLQASVKQDHADKSKKQQCTACERANVKYSFENLKTYPWVAEKLKQKAIDLYGWYFNLKACQIEQYSAMTDSFSAD